MATRWAARFVAGCLIGSGAARAEIPVLVSPGAPGRLVASVSSCPTFSWAASGIDSPLELVVYRVESDGSLAQRPALHERLPAGASAWTPSPDRCLSPGDYAWMLRQRGAGEWSEAHLFAVARDPRDEELRELRRLVEELRSAALQPRVGAAPPVADGRPAEGGGRSAPPRVDLESLFDPPNCGAGIFADVPPGDAFCEWIEAAYQDDLVAACATDPGLAYCPKNAVTREQVAVFLEKVRHGAAGGVLTGNYPDPGLAPEYELPQGCPTGQLAQWSGSAWQCTQCIAAADCPSPPNVCEMAACDTFVCGATPVPAGSGGPGTACDGNDTDLCVEGVMVCDGAGGTTCNDETGNTVEICNSQDDDCNGAADDGLGGEACSTGFPGVCAQGLTLCSGGTMQCTGIQPGSQPEICVNGEDDDCDTLVDEAECTP